MPGARGLQDGDHTELGRGVGGEEVERRKKQRDKWGGAQIRWSEVVDRGLGEGKKRKGKEE
jgi:hypothetical protein